MVPVWAGATEWANWSDGLGQSLTIDRVPFRDQRDMIHAVMAGINMTAL